MNFQRGDVADKYTHIYNINHWCNMSVLEKYNIERMTDRQTEKVRKFRTSGQTKKKRNNK